MQYDLADEAATIAAASTLSGILRRGDFVALEGDLGAGKSTLARALIRALPLADGSTNADEDVPSPTYTLCQVYDRALGQVAHFDLYRLSEPEEALELGIEEALATGIALVEWPQRLGALLTARRLHLSLQDAGQGRRLHIDDYRT